MILPSYLMGLMREFEYERVKDELSRFCRIRHYSKFSTKAQIVETNCSVEML